MMNNPRPLSLRKTIRLLIGLTILAWATQTLLIQWGYGQDVTRGAAEPTAEDVRATEAAIEFPAEIEAPPVGDAEAEAQTPRGRGDGAEVLPVSEADFDADVTTSTPATEPAAEADVDAPAPRQEPAAAAEDFAPGTARFAAGATLELRGEATVVGAEVRLKQACRWTEADAAVFAPLADLVLARLDEGRPFVSITLQDVRATLRDAGANLAVIRLAGPTSCTVSRSDVKVDERDALAKWAAAREAGGPEGTEVAAAAETEPLDSEEASSVVEGDVPVAASEPVESRRTTVAEGEVRTLKSLLAADLAQRLNLEDDQVEMAFNPRDEKVLKLAEPAFKFNILPKRVRNLGSVSWEVTIVAGDSAQKTSISASARAWQQQAVVARPLTFRQVIRPGDVIERRALVDRLSDDALLGLKQIVGQQAARDLRPGMVVTAKMVDAVPLVQSGQFVTITLERGGVRVKTVARAMEGGSFGQTVRVKNEATRDIYEVVLTGPQEGTLNTPKPSAEPNVASVGND